MFSSGPRYNKLKVNLKLAINRLNLLAKKKTEQALKARKEIANYIADGKDDRAKIRVEHIIREDYMVEVMEMLELYCDLLLARFGLIQQMKTLDDGLAEAVSTVIWVAPRLQADIAEFKSISDELTAKYGKQYVQAVRENCLKTVNTRVIHKLSAAAPPAALVENYMIEIAKSHNVHYEPDQEVLRQNEMMAAEAIAADNPLIDFNDKKGRFGGGSGGGGGSGMPAPPIGFVSIPPQPGTYPPPQPGTYPPPQPGSYPPGEAAGGFPPVPNAPPSGSLPPKQSAGGFSHPMGPTPSYDSVMAGSTNNAAAPPPSKPVDSLPELPAVPLNSLPKLDDLPPPGSGSADDPDFDDLTRRFEELKKRK